MKLDIYETREALQKYSEYREIQLRDCVQVQASIKTVLIIFNCHEVKGLDDERYIFTPFVNSPSPDMPARLFLDIEMPGKKLIKVSFSWESGIPQRLLEVEYLVFMAAKKPDYIKKGHSMTARDLYKLAGPGCLDIDLIAFSKWSKRSLEAIIAPIELMVRLGISPDDGELQQRPAPMM